MAGKNIFIGKLFLPLNISDFVLFFILKLYPPEKGHRSLSQQPPSQQHPSQPPAEKRGAHVVLMTLF